MIIIVVYDTHPQATLQWSHDVTVVEMPRYAHSARAAGWASMEPRRHRRGDVHFEYAA